MLPWKAQFLKLAVEPRSIFPMNPPLLVSPLFVSVSVDSTWQFSIVTVEFASTLPTMPPAKSPFVVKVPATLRLRMVAFLTFKKGAL